ncbi:hypothetical protein THII_1065 [Thioploca ingrica]|uniref:DUF29 domain-containing protein n=1 Tax=Thioploca ingrica TaxID=40754 RepID=A0A090AIT4_9GAMM|nr:hypothetical protein THII_1065 [Thioploca ingrica]
MNTLERDYEQDFYAWIQHNIALLKQGKLNEIDIDILIDELESMAKRDKRELTSRLMILMAHLLKWQFQPNKQSGSWQSSIDEQRIQIIEQLEESPSLKNTLHEGIGRAYPKAVTLAAKETGLSLEIFPKECPYRIEQLLDDDFYPENRV